MIQNIEDDKGFTHRWVDDVKRIQQVLLDNNYSSLLKDCAELWENYSDLMCVGWVSLPDYDDELFETLEWYID